MADRLRARAVIEDEIAALAPHQTGDAIGAPPGEAAREVGEFRRSARQALRWLLVGGPGPLLAEVDVRAGPVPARAVVAELGRAEKVIYGRSSRRLRRGPRPWGAARVDVGAVRGRDLTVAVAGSRSLIPVGPEGLASRYSPTLPQTTSPAYLYAAIRSAILNERWVVSGAGRPIAASHGGQRNDSHTRHPRVIGPYDWPEPTQDRR